MGSWFLKVFNFLFLLINYLVCWNFELNVVIKLLVCVFYWLIGCLICFENNRNLFKKVKLLVK